MKLFHKIAATLALIVATVAVASPSNAAIVHLGNLTIGDSGVIANSSDMIGSTYAYGQADGYLPSNSMITFTYNTSILPPGIPYALGSVITLASNTLSFFLSANGDNTGLSFQLSPVFMPTAFVPPSVWPVMTIVGPNTAVIENVSGQSAYFSSYFLSLINGLVPGSASSYVVSAIPLPPAILLMIASMAGLGGLAARKKLKQAA